MKRKDLQLGITVITEEHKRVYDQLQGDLGNRRLLGQLEGLSYALGVLSGIMDIDKERRSK